MRRFLDHPMAEYVLVAAIVVALVVLFLIWLVPSPMGPMPI